MVQQLPKSEIFYPDSDGQPMADNTEQFQWIVTIKENLELLYADDPNVFVAGDLLWYPVEGENKLRAAPDAMVAFSRPKGYRGSYKQWEEGDIAPQVVFEILSPGNRRGEMARKLQFYNRYGVEEYYEYDPYNIELTGWQRQNGLLEVIDGIEDWISPRLDTRFVVTEETWEIYRPDGARFLTFVELGQRLDTANQQLSETSQQLSETSQQLSETSQQLSETSQQLEDSQAKAERLAERLRELGVDPSEV